MKKITLIVSAGLFCCFGFAQSFLSPVTSPIEGVKLGKESDIKISLADKRPTNSSVQGSSSYWLNYAYANDQNIGPGVSVANFNYLFWDSLPLVKFGSVYDHPWINNLGDVLDVSSSVFSGAISGYNMNKSSAYTLDSMGVEYAYVRNFSDGDAVDTLVVQLYNNSTSANMPTYYFTKQQANYGQDTVFFKAQKYTYSNNSANAVGVVTIKVPLTKADTAIKQTRFKYFNTNAFAVPAGKLLAVAVTFKPGYSYALNDTLKNIFNFVSYEEQGSGSGASAGLGTFPVYYTCGVAKVSTCDWNVSSIVRNSERYNESGNSWNGLFVPSYAFVQKYAFEHHSFSYKVTPTNVGINDVSLDKVTVQNIPNPFNDNTYISYELVEGANVTLEIFDLTGKKVQTINEGRKFAGSHNIQFNGGNLQAGVYFYTLTAGETRVTKRMTLVK